MEPMSTLRTLVLALATLCLVQEACAASDSRRQLLLGGDEVSPNTFHPHVGSLQLVLNRRRSHLCGSVLVAPQWVLTTSHCLESWGVPDKVTFGRTWLASGTTRDDGRPVLEIHESVSRNLALIRLKEPLDSDVFPPAQLSASPAYPLESPGTTLRVAGWVHDLSSTDGEPAPTYNNEMQSLREMHGSLQTSCAALGPGSLLPAVDQSTPSSDLCWRGVASDWGADEPPVPSRCFGDEGLPLFGYNAEGSAVAVGIVSAHGGCGTPVYEVRAIRLSEHIEWIESKVGTKVTAPTKAPSSAPSRSPSTSEPSRSPSPQPSQAPTTPKPTSAPTLRTLGSGVSPQDNANDKDMMTQALEQPVVLGAAGGGVLLLIAVVAVVAVRRRHLKKNQQLAVSAAASPGQGRRRGGGGGNGGGGARGSPQTSLASFQGPVQPEELSPRGSTREGHGRRGGNPVWSATFIPTGVERPPSGKRFVPKRISGII